MILEVIIQNFIVQYGTISIFCVVLLEYANLPIPSEVVLPFIGLLVAAGSITFQEAVVVSVVAGIIGSLINYFIGLYFGKPVLKYILNKQPKLEKSVTSSMWWVNKYGKVSVMLSRVVPLARTFISIPAGVIRMNMWSFIIYSTVGIGMWNIALICFGMIFGNNIKVISTILNRYSIVMRVLVIMIVTFIMVKRIINKKVQNK